MKRKICLENVGKGGFFKTLATTFFSLLSFILSTLFFCSCVSTLFYDFLLIIELHPLVLFLPPAPHPWSIWLFFFFFFFLSLWFFYKVSVAVRSSGLSVGTRKTTALIMHLPLARHTVDVFPQPDL